MGLRRPRHPSITRGTSPRATNGASFRSPGISSRAKRRMRSFKRYSISVSAIPEPIARLCQPFTAVIWNCLSASECSYSLCSNRLITLD